MTARSGERLWYDALMRLFSFALFALLPSVGCAPALSEAGAKVLYTKNAADVAGCSKLGSVESGTFAQKTGDDPQRDVRNDLRNKAAAMGGTNIVIDEGPLGLGKAASADVYKCGGETASAATAEATAEPTAEPAAEPTAAASAEPTP